MTQAQGKDMIISSWNIRGLNLPFKQKELKAFMLKNKVSLMAVLETRVKENKVAKVTQTLGVDWQLGFNYNYATNGRIWVGWKPAHLDLTILHTTSQVIHCYVEDKDTSFASYITFVYGFNTVGERKEMWDQLRTIYSSLTGPWLILGDFNALLSVDDRLHGNPVHITETEDFQECVNDLGLGQVTRRGCQYSWCNKRDVGDRIYSHIDWIFGNYGWFQNYSNIEADYMNPGCSDCSPIVLNTVTSFQHIKQPYKLLNVLLEQESYKRYSRRVLGPKDHWDSDLTLSKTQLLHDERTTIDQLHKWDAIQERQGKPGIGFPKIYNEHHVKLTDPIAIHQEFVLLLPVTTEEVYRALRSMPNDKAPGSDGYPVEFFRQFWPLIGQDITEVVIHFFKNGKMLKEINSTTVTLVPKVANPNYVKDYKPIASCTTLYKLISKVLMVRIKTVVDKLVGQSQSAFIEGRNILDNVIIAYELINSYSQKHVSPRCTDKVDIRKAYDSVEWALLRWSFKNMGSTSVVQPIMTCVSTFKRSLKQLRHTPDFKYHPRCARLNLVHICFADDLLMVCQADMGSLHSMLQRFYHFSEVSGLKANMEKNSLYVAGITDVLRDQMLDDFHFTLGSLPFKYLGVPLSSRKLAKSTGLMGHYVSAKSTGGLNILNFFLWNKAAICKLLWVVAKKKKRLWVLWIHAYYVKGDDFGQTPTPKQASWVVRKIFDARKWWADWFGLVGTLRQCCISRKV
ncbi:uncharacterized protein LOC132038189 [Lycium ferocissimum]|uniref:uncharacterized protein LOC132038189 n=1 Tax=Lycium ferocissimum TaxID=112874 RepID=UPI002815A0BF|nr:uncharacterized protein LOC132038189 [Lycium ferocissimum]